MAIVIAELLKLENIPSIKCNLKIEGITMRILGTVLTVLGKPEFNYKESNNQRDVIMG